MKHTLWIAIVLFSLAGLSPAQQVDEAASGASAKNAALAIETELESHGDRIMGKDAYHWSTRLEKLDACRAEFSVRITSKLGDTTVHVENVSLSLGAIDPYGIEIQEHGLQLPCAEGNPCIFSTSTCTRTSADGIVTDCTTPSQKRVEAFNMELDGNADSAHRLRQALRQAAESCRQLTVVAF